MILSKTTNVEITKKCKKNALQVRPGVPLPSPEQLKRKILIKNKKNDDLSDLLPGAFRDH